MVGCFIRELAGVLGEGLRLLNAVPISETNGHRVEMPDTDRILEILGGAKLLAQEYRRLTGKPLGIAGEVAEYEAAHILGVQLTPARQA